MTRVVSAIILSGLAFSGLAACTKASSAADPKSEAAAINAVEDGMAAAFKAKDAAKLAASYAPDGTLYTPGSMRPRMGTKSLLEGAKQDLADPGFSIAITRAKTQVSASGDMGYTQGSFSLRYTDPKTKQGAGYSGFYLTVFKKQADGSWKAIEDMATPAS
jgi:uncharacterized protein (TIGR02246 family)